MTIDTLPSLIQQHAMTKAASQAFIFLNDSGQEQEVLTFGELHNAALSIAFELKDYKGERALLLFSPGLDFIKALLACWYAGLTIVPAPLPAKQGMGTDRLLNIIKDSKVKLVLCEVKQKDLLACLFIPAGIEISIIATDSIISEAFFEPVQSKPSDVALLQYTSGSTGDPKGVMVSHESLMHNLKGIELGFEHSETSKVASWLPMFHDMGLIGKVFQPLYLGVLCVLMSPMTFLKRPVVWLKAISDYQITSSGAPNFAFDFCCNRIKDEDCLGLDLSSWRVAFNASEAIRHKSLQNFAEKFAPFGLSKGSLYTCYGLAESTLFSAGSYVGKGPSILGVDQAELESGQILLLDNQNLNAKILVSSGKPRNLELLIVDPVEGNRLPEAQIGEIWLKGKSIASGYWNRSELTKDTFGASIEGSTGWLRTGDLGFMYEGELFVTGRIKELIIINGRNIYPHDVEDSIQASHSAFRKGSGVAFSYDLGDREELVVLQEVSKGLSNEEIEKLAGLIRKVVRDNLGLGLGALVLLKGSTLLKTTSGKLMRTEMKHQFIANSLDFVWEEVGERVELSRRNRGLS